MRQRRGIIGFTLPGSGDHDATVVFRGYGESGGRMTHPRNAPRDSGGSAETAAFLRDMRAPRDQAGLGPRDLAARAHFPEDTLVTAEAGPGLPSLPVVQAYVRGCGAPELEWEDRWRQLNSSDTGDSGSALPTRAPSASRAAARVPPFPVAGSDPDSPDQNVIGFGLERVARGLVPLSSDSAEAQRDAGPRAPFGGAPGGYGETNHSAQHSAPGNGSNGAGGWFDPGPRFPPPPDQSYNPPPAAPPAPPTPPAPPVNPGAPTVQYPAVTGYQGSEQSGYQGSDQSYASPTPYSEPSVPSYRLPEEFRTPVPPPPDLPGPTGGRPGPGSAGGPVAPGGYGGNRPGAGGAGPRSRVPLRADLAWSGRFDGFRHDATAPRGGQPGGSPHGTAPRGTAQPGRTQRPSGIPHHSGRPAAADVGLGDRGGGHRAGHRGRDLAGAVPLAWLVLSR